MRRMASAAKKINPQHLKGKPEAKIVTVLHDESDKILCFCYHSFVPGFICRFKNEIPKLVTESNQDRGFDKLVTSNKFQTRIQKRIKRKKLDPNFRLTWDNDDAEYS